MSRKKSWIEKLKNNKDLPKIVTLEGKQAKQWGGGTMVVPAPMEVYEIMSYPKYGELLTLSRIREILAEKHGTTTACPLTTGIFAWISANASEEMMTSGKGSGIAWWRTLKGKGELNPKYPGHILKQRDLLIKEGFTVFPKGDNFFVSDYEKYLI